MIIQIHFTFEKNSLVSTASTIVEVQGSTVNGSRNLVISPLIQMMMILILKFIKIVLMIKI